MGKLFILNFYNKSGKGGKMKMLGKPTRIDDRKRVVIPTEVMNFLNAKEGDYIVFEKKDDNIVIRKAKLVIVTPTNEEITVPTWLTNGRCRRGAP